MNMHTYEMSHKAANGKVTTLKANLGGDADARYWAKTLVERDGGTVIIELQDGTTFTWPV